MPKSFSYGDYLAGLGGSRFTAQDDSGYQQDNALGEDAWGRMTDDEQWGSMGQTGGGSGWMPTSGQGFTLPENSDIARRWAAANQRPDYMAEMGQERNRFYVTRDQPDAAQLRGGAWQDPDSGSWVVPHENVRPEILQAEIDRVDNSGVFRGRGLRPILTGMGMVLGAGGLHTALTGGGGLFGGAAAGLEDIPASVLADSGGSVLGAGLEDIPASILESGPPDSYWSQLADSGVPMSDAGGGVLEGNMPFEPGLDIPDFAPGPEGSFPDTAWSPSSDPTGWERFLNDPTGYASRLSGGGNMNWMDMITGDRGLGWRDVLSVGRDLLGGHMDQRNQDRNNQVTAEERERARQMQREMGFVNQDSPFGSVTNERDPTTGYWTRHTTLKPEDQSRLDSWRTMAGNRMTHAAGMQLPGNVDFQANLRRFLPPSLGGTYVNKDPWGRT